MGVLPMIDESQMMKEWSAPSGDSSYQMNLQLTIFVMSCPEWGSKNTLPSTLPAQYDYLTWPFDFKI